MTVSDPIEEPEPIVLRAALRYAALGLRVIPIHPGQKRPVGDEWQNRATTNPTTIRMWWGENPQYGVGLVMGWYGKRCVFAVDVDNGVDDKTGRVKEGSESLRDLELSYGPLPETVTSLSGGGGQHIILWADVEINNDQAGRLGLDLDLRGVGGQIVVWPTIHPNGNSYQWEDDRAPSDHKIAQAPAWLIDILTRPLAEPKAERQPYSGTPRPGDRFAANVTWPELLTGDGATFLGDRVDRQSGHSYELWARPGADHTSATLYYRGSDVLKVFTPNWPGLAQDETYTRFGYWTATRYGGDFARAAAALAQIERDEFIATFATSLPPNPDPVSNDGQDEPTTVGADRLRNGAEFVLDGPTAVTPRWGDGDDVLWAEGEALLIASPPGVGKTTVAIQAVGALTGIEPGDFLGLPVRPARKVLYLAMDRPRQIRRAMARRFQAEHRDLLAERLVVWEGPLEQDIGRKPEHLLALAVRAGADIVVIDSLKDAAVKITDDEVGGNVNRAIQLCIAAGIDVLVLHHQRKGQNGEKPKTIEDVYGSTWIPAGAGSVVLLWGAPGDPIVEMIHLKQPLSEVGPWKLEHDHLTGTTSVYRGFDALAFLRLHTKGVTVIQTARTMFEKQAPTDNERRKAQRTLDGLVARGMAVKKEPQIGGDGGTTGAVYHLAEVRMEVQ